MEKPPKPPSRTRPEAMPGLALSPLTLSGYSAAKNGSENPKTSISEDSSSECQQPTQPCNEAALKESKE